MVEVFKTDVQTKAQSEMIIKILLDKFYNHEINFDLEDCDNILRVKGENIQPNDFINLLNKNGFTCEVL